MTRQTRRTTLVEPLAVETPRTIPAPQPESCGRCRFFQWDEDGPTGACHRGPPRSGQAAGNWPVVRPGDWCGEFNSPPFNPWDGAT